MREQEWDVIPSKPHPAHMHMALDEVLLESVRPLPPPDASPLGVDQPRS